MKNLIIILGETRTHGLTFNNFKENADLCICVEYLIKEFLYIMHAEIIMEYRYL